MSNERGSSLVEVLVAALIGSGLAIGMIIFFLASLRLGKDVDAQAALQRQGSAIAEELGRRLREVPGAGVTVEDPTTPPLNPVCLPLPTNDVVLVIPDRPPAISVTCFYRDTASPPRIVRCTRPTPEPAPDEPCEPVANLLSGSLVPLSASCGTRPGCIPWTASVVTECSVAGGTCDESDVCSIINQQCNSLGAKVVFTLSDVTNAPETFGVTIVTSRLNP